MMECEVIKIDKKNLLDKIDVYQSDIGLSKIRYDDDSKNNIEKVRNYFSGITNNTFDVKFLLDTLVSDDDIANVLIEFSNNYQTCYYKKIEKDIKTNGCETKYFLIGKGVKPTINDVGYTDTKKLAETIFAGFSGKFKTLGGSLQSSITAVSDKKGAVTLKWDNMPVYHQTTGTGPGRSVSVFGCVEDFNMEGKEEKRVYIVAVGEHSNKNDLTKYSLCFHGQENGASDFGKGKIITIAKK